MAAFGSLRLASLGVLLLVLGMQIALAQERFNREVQFDIAAQSIEAALIEFSKQADVQVMVGGALNGRKTEGVKGKLSVSEALQQLLKDTGLEYQTTGNTVTIRSVKNARADSRVIPVTPLRLASANAAGEADSSNSKVDQPSRSSVETLDEVVVTGSRLRQANPGAITTFDRQKIDAIGASTIADVLKYLPQQPYRREEGFLGSGSQSIELRGLGVDSTLVLINGRRTVASAVNLTSNAFDLNSIPLAAVERIEVLSDSASAVYGADAMGGVLNIILKKEIPEPVIELNYGFADGGAEERRASLSAGYSNDRVRVSAIADYFDRSSLLGNERSRWSDQDFRRFGGDDLRSTTANPGNVSSVTGDSLPGLDEAFAAVPHGSTGIGLTPADFAATAGQQNLDSVMRYWSIVPETERKGAAIFGEFDLTDDLSVFGEVLYSNRKSMFQTEPASSFFDEVPETNPFNPFGEPVFIEYLFDGLPPMRVRYDTELTREALGLRGRLGSWDWEISAMHSSEEASSWTENELDIDRMLEALASDDPAQALNVFADGPAGSPSLLASLVLEPDHSDLESTGTQASGFLRGTPLQLPAGSLEVVLGGEWRKEEILFDDFTFVEQDRDVSAAFAEVQIPLVSDAANVPAVTRLGLTVAARYDEYSDFGSTFNPQYSLSWSPVHDLTFRLSYGTAFRAPSLFELYAPRTSVPNVIQDPRRNNQITPHTLITGGNPDLDPIEADSRSAGFVFEPAAAPGFKFSSTYWQIEMDQRVALFSPQLILANESLFPERVVRAAPTPADVAAGLPGRILSLDSSRVNFGRLETSGVDIAMAYALESELGRWNPSIAATWVDKYESSDVPTRPKQERVGVANFSGTISRWKAVASLAWSLRGLGVTVSARYTPAYDDAIFSGARTGRTIPSQTLVDLQTSVDLTQVTPSTFFRGMKISAGVSNLFDKEPPFAEINGPAGYDRSQGDLRQRFGYVRLSKAF